MPHDDFENFTDEIDENWTPEDEEEEFDISDVRHLMEDDTDDAEQDRRTSAYQDLKRNDKIFGNTYNMGLEVSEEDEVNSRSNSTEIKLDSSSPDYYLQDSEKYLEHVDLKIIQHDIYNFMQSNKEVIAILGNDPAKKKFTKTEINQLFDIILFGLSHGEYASKFISAIYVLDSISSSINIEYKKIFDLLTYENKEKLLVELNKKYNFLDSIGKNFKMF